MKKSNGELNKFNLAVFISGRGSNLKSIINFSLKKNSIYNVKLVISNNKNANGLKLAKKRKIENYVINFTNSKKLSKKVLLKLKKENIKLICLAGFMKILPYYFIKLYRGKIINIHPSLLPKYKGLKTHERVIQNKEKYTGCTVHYVNKHLDSGKIILQKKIKVFKHDTAESIKKRVLDKEHQIYFEAILKIFNAV